MIYVEFSRKNKPCDTAAQFPWKKFQEYRRTSDRYKFRKKAAYRPRPGTKKNQQTCNF